MRKQLGKLLIGAGVAIGAQGIGEYFAIPYADHVVAFGFAAFAVAVMTQRV